MALSPWNKISSTSVCHSKRQASLDPPSQIQTQHRYVILNKNKHMERKKKKQQKTKNICLQPQSSLWAENERTKCLQQCCFMQGWEVFRKYSEGTAVDTTLEKIQHSEKENALDHEICSIPNKLKAHCLVIYSRLLTGHLLCTANGC